MDKLTPGVTIELNQREVLLQEVILSTKINWTAAALNQFSRCGNWGLVTSGFQTQVAQHLRAPVSNAILTGLRICTNTSSLAPAPTMFRVRVYAMDSLTGKPSFDLCDEVIEVKSKNKTISVSLESYNIHIPDRDFFVAIEWLKIPYNESRVVVRHQDGRKEELIRYRPSISMTEGEEEGPAAWMLTYQHHWTPMLVRRSTASISATVKY